MQENAQKSCLSRPNVKKITKRRNKKTKASWLGEGKRVLQHPAFPASINEIFLYYNITLIFLIRNGDKYIKQKEKKQPRGQEYPPPPMKLQKKNLPVRYYNIKIN